MIGNPKASGGVTSAAKLLEQRPFQELPVGCTFSNQGFMSLMQMHQKIITAPANQGRKTDKSESVPISELASGIAGGQNQTIATVPFSPGLTAPGPEGAQWHLDFGRRSHWILARENWRNTMQRCLTRCCGGSHRQRCSHCNCVVNSDALCSISAHSDGCPCFKCLDKSWRRRNGILQSKHSDEMKWRMSGSEIKSSHLFV